MTDGTDAMRHFGKRPAHFGQAGRHRHVTDGPHRHGVMFVYWDLHTKPFRPLTEAIGRTFKHSLPKVEGGRHRAAR